MTYRVNEIFLSLQGEGVRAGTVNTFVRFSGCNLRCNRAEDGFDCDTEFVSGRDLSADELVDSLNGSEWVVLTGGEPTLQFDAELLSRLRTARKRIAVETNGLRPLPGAVDWLTVSPKTAEHTLSPFLRPNELKYIRHAGQGLPKPALAAEHYLIQPAWEPDGVSRETLRWCVELCKKNPPWRLSCQNHKWWGIR